MNEITLQAHAHAVRWFHPGLRMCYGKLNIDFKKKLHAVISVHMT